MSELVKITPEFQSLLVQSGDSNKAVAMEAQFEEAYNIAMFKVADKYRIENQRKPSKENLRGEVLMTNPALMDLLRECINMKTVYQKTLGELRLYTSAYATVSRLVALRTKSYEESIYGRDA